VNKEDYGLVCVRYPRGKETPAPKDFSVTTDDWQCYGDSAADTAIVTYGRIFAEAAEAVRELKYCGTNAKIIKLNKINPIPENAVNAVIECKNVFFFEEGMKQGGVSEGFTSLMVDKGYSGKINITAVDNAFVPHGSMKELLKDLKLDRDGIISVVTEKLNS